jgi:hypothetical protein
LNPSQARRRRNGSGNAPFLDGFVNKAKRRRRLTRRNGSLRTAQLRSDDQRLSPGFEGHDRCDVLSQVALHF